MGRNAFKELINSLYRIKCMCWLPPWLSGKESACNAEDAGPLPGSGTSPGGEVVTCAHILPGKARG